MLKSKRNEELKKYELQEKRLRAMKASGKSSKQAVSILKQFHRLFQIFKHTMLVYYFIKEDND